MKYEVIGWTSCRTDKYKAHENITASVDNAVIAEIRKRGYCFGGDIQDDYCPVLNDGTYVLYSSRGWGGVMAKAHGVKDDNGYAYMGYYMNEFIKSECKKYPTDYPAPDKVVPKESLAETFVMHLSDDMFEKIKAGTKTVETRLFDEKRQLVDIGDYILFVKESDKTQRVKRRVADMEVGRTFKEVFDAFRYEYVDGNLVKQLRFTPQMLGFADGSTIETMAERMYDYYKEEQEKKHGVVSFILEETKHTCRVCFNVWTDRWCLINECEYNDRAYEKGMDSSRIDEMDDDFYLYEKKEQDVTALIGEVEEGYVEVLSGRVVEIGRNEEYDADVNVMIRKTLKHLFGKEKGLRAIQDEYWLAMTLDVVVLTDKDSKEPPQNLQLDEDIKEFLQKANVELNWQKYSI